MANENTLPERAAATPRSTAAVSTRLSVPRWSSSPHRPALETLAASCCRWWGRATSRPGGGRAHPRQHLGGEQLEARPRQVGVDAAHQRGPYETLEGVVGLDEGHAFVR